MTSKTQIFFALALLSFLLASLIVITRPSGSSTGAVDFIQYWTAFRVTLDGLNPYVDQPLLELQQQLRTGLATPVMMWNPPWIFFVLGPLLAFEYPISEILFITLNCFLLLTSIVIILERELFDDQHRFDLRACVVAILLTFAFPPTPVFIAMGQSSGFLLLGAALGLKAIRDRTTWPLIAALFCISIKPQSLYVLGAWLLYELLRRQSRAALVLTISSGLGILLATYVVFPVAISSWLTAILQGSDTSRPMFSWSPMSFITPLVSTFCDPVTRICIRMVAAATATGTLIVVFLFRQKLMIYRPEFRVGAVIFFSVITAPHILFWDFLSLLVLYLPSIFSLWKTPSPYNIPLVALLIMAHLIWFFLESMYELPYGIVVWFPLLSMMALLLAERNRKNSPGHLREAL